MDTTRDARTAWIPSRTGKTLCICAGAPFPKRLLVSSRSAGHRFQGWRRPG